MILGSIEKQLKLEVEKYLKDDNEREKGDNLRVLTLSSSSSSKSSSFITSDDLS